MSDLKTAFENISKVVAVYRGELKEHMELQENLKAISKVLFPDTTEVKES